MRFGEVERWPNPVRDFAANMTVHRCHFAASGAYDPLVNLAPLGQDRGQCSVAYRDHAKKVSRHPQRRMRHSPSAASLLLAWGDEY